MVQVKFTIWSSTKGLSPQNTCSAGDVPWALFPSNDQLHRKKRPLRPFAYRDHDQLRSAWRNSPSAFAREKFCAIVPAP
jgi:hypothetical protein